MLNAVLVTCCGLLISVQAWVTNMMRRWLSALLYCLYWGSWFIWGTFHHWGLGDRMLYAYLVFIFFWVFWNNRPRKKLKKLTDLIGAKTKAIIAKMVEVCTPKGRMAPT